MAVLYSAVPGSDCGDDIDHKSRRTSARVSSRTRFVRIALGVFALTLISIAFFSGMVYRETVIQEELGSASGCQNPATRKEWRALSRDEQLAYTDAVHCLTTLPSMLGVDQSLYDDFPYIHSRIGNYSHNTEDFLVWHRYFLHIYENTLRDRCGYTGHLTYWDWSLDSEDLSKSPIFDSTYGFGGNGNPYAAKSVAYGHCVTDGPFANLEVLYFGTQDRKHCLSRGFIDKKEAQEKALNYNPAAIRKLLDTPDYDNFYHGLENGAHNSVPTTIRGDFFKVTAPNDPLFFLHHAQLDRLWWVWQSRDPAGRISKLLGRHSTDEEEYAQLSPLLRVGDLAVDIPGYMMLDSSNGFLCYEYE